MTLGSLLAIVTACPADPEPNDTQAASSSGPGPVTGSTLGPEDCGTAGCCPLDSTFCESTGGSLDSADATGSSTGSDTGPGVEPPCGFGPTLAMLAMGKTDPLDCGTVTLDDDVTAWQAASDCAASAAVAQEGFLVAFQLPSVDSLVFAGYYGVVGLVYGTGRLYTDTLGDLGEPWFSSTTCMSIVATVGCVVDVGQHCLECVDSSPQTALECVMR